MSDAERFEKNVDRWARFCPKEAKAVGALSCERVFFAQDGRNLTIVKEGTKEFLHSQEDPVAEAQQWFASLNLQGISVIIVCGVGLGYYYDAAKQWLQDPKHYLIFLEDDLEVIHRFLETERGTQLLHDMQTRLLYGDRQSQAEGVCMFLARTFWRGEFVVSALESYERSDPNWLHQIRAQLSFWMTMQRAIFREYLIFGRHFFSNFYSNLRVLPTSFFGNGLYGKFSGIPAIICGAGPSLDKNLAVLETLADRALIFAGGTAMNAVNSRGFLPHFGVGIDPNIEQLTRIIMNTAYEVPFFYRNRVNRKALRFVHGPRLYVTGSGGFAISDWLEEQLHITGYKVEEGFNVVNFSLAIAHAMGCNPIIFAGLDLAYTDQHSYQSGVISHPTHQRRHDFRTKNVDEELLVKNDINDRPVNTLWKWIGESIWLGEFAQRHPETLFINATEGGLGMPGIVNKPLSEVAEHLLLRQFDLRVHVHGEVQNHHMPSEVTPQRVQQLMSEIRESLFRCQEYCKGLEHESTLISQELTEGKQVTESLMTEKGEELREKLIQETAYKYILREFEESFEQGLALEYQRLEYDTTLNANQIASLKASLQTTKYSFLKETAIVSMTCIDLDSITWSPPLGLLVSQAVSEKKQTVQSIYPEGVRYSFEDHHLILVDPELGLSYQESGDTKLAIQTNTLHYPSGAIKMECFWRNGRLHGPATFYSDTGSILARSWYVDGEQQGRMVSYYHTGALYSVQQFRDGKAEGVQLFYFPDGRTKTNMIYSQGKLNGEVWLYHPNGVRQRELHFVQGKRTGIERVWNESGALIIEAEYIEDRAVGKAKTWHDNGRLSQEITYDDESQVIEIKNWNESGILLPKQALTEEEYFNAVTKQTGILTQSLANLLEQLNDVAPILIAQAESTMDPEVLKKELLALKREIQHLESMSNELHFESGLEAKNPLEPIWKTPASKREMQVQLKKLTDVLQRDMNGLREVIKNLSKHKQQ